MEIPHRIHEVTPSSGQTKPANLLPRWLRPARAGMHAHVRASACLLWLRACACVRACACCVCVCAMRACSGACLCVQWCSTCYECDILLAIADDPNNLRLTASELADLRAKAEDAVDVDQVGAVFL